MNEYICMSENLENVKKNWNFCDLFIQAMEHTHKVWPSVGRHKLKINTYPPSAY